MTRVLISAEDRRRLADVTRRANYGVTFKDLDWLLRTATRLLAERDELLEQVGGKSPIRTTKKGKP